MNRYAWLIVWALSAPAAADVVLLKNGQRIEGDVQEKDGQVMLRTAVGDLVLPKDQVLKIVRKVEVITAEAETLQKRGRFLFEEAGGLPPSDSKAVNAKLREAVDFLRKAADLLQEARETYSDEKYDSLDRTVVKLFQEMRIYRDRMVSEIAAPVTPKPEEKPAATPEPKPEPKPPAAPVPAGPAAPKSAPAGIDLAALQLKAKGGDLSAMYSLAVHLDQREWISAEAVKWYKAASDRGHARAMNRLGMLHLAGRAGKPDVKEALKWIQRAEGKGLALAQAQLGMMYYDGLGVPRSFRKADEVCEKAAKKIRAEADAGDPESQLACSWMLRTGMGVYEMEPAKAVEYCRQAAEQGYLPAQNELGLMHVEGKGTAANRAEGLRWLKSAAEAGHAEAQANLGKMYDSYQTALNPGNADFRQARDWYGKALAQGHPWGLYRTGTMTLQGLEVAKNEAEAVRLYGKALQTAVGRTRRMCLNDLGYCYDNGLGVKRDVKDALRYFREAAEVGDVLAQYNIGWISSKYPEFRNEKEALKWYLAAAVGGYVKAQFEVGEIYFSGIGVKRDLDEAERWYVMAAQQGWKAAQDALVRLRQERAAKRR